MRRRLIPSTFIKRITSLALEWQTLFELNKNDQFKDANLIKPDQIIAFTFYTVQQGDGYFVQNCCESSL
jgi:hypothetical protein